MSETEKLSPILWRHETPEKSAGSYQYLHWCPGCKCGHTYHVGSSGRPSWSFNGNAEKPSFNPSMLLFEPLDGGGRRSICHYYVTDGEIRYQPDCEHELAGKSLPLPPIPEDYGF